MHRFLERFSAFAGTAVIFVYLGGLGLGTASYFIGKAIGLSPDVTLAAGIGLAIAVEVHSFLSQRLTRSLWQVLHKLPETAPEYDATRAQFRTHLWITIGLVLFSVFNSIAFWATVTHATSPGEWAQVCVRGAVIPAAFLAAGFLTPLHYDASRMLATAAALMLNRSIKVTMRQWRARLAAAERAHLNLAPVAAVLMEDAGESDGARRLRIIDAALTAAEGGPTVRTERADHFQDTPNVMPPDALTARSAPLAALTGTEGQAVSTHAASAPSARREGATLTLLQQAAPRRRASPRVKRKQTINARKVRTGGTGYESYRDSMEAAYLQGATSVDQLMAATGAVRSTAAKWKAALDEKYVPAAQEA